MYADFPAPPPAIVACAQGTHAGAPGMAKTCPPGCTSCPSCAKAAKAKGKNAEAKASKPEAKAGKPEAKATGYRIDSLARFGTAAPGVTPVYGTSHLRMTVYALEPGQEISPHAGPAEAYMLVYKGKGLFTVDDRKFEAGPGTIVASAAEGLHGFKAIDRMVILAIAAPIPAGVHESSGPSCHPDPAGRHDH